MRALGEGRQWHRLGQQPVAIEAKVDQRLAILDLS
jgi:hypothetical protein